MKNNLRVICILIMFFLQWDFAKSQTTVLGHLYPGGPAYLGWDATLGNPALDIKTTLNQPINFFTSGSKHMVLDAFGILDLVNATQYYSLGGNRILSYGGGGNSSSVFVGRGGRCGMGHESFNLCRE